MKQRRWKMVLGLVLAGVLAASSTLAQSGGKPVVPPVELPSGGAWDVQDQTSPVDGRRTYSAILTSINTVPNSIGRPEHVYLAVRCQGRTVSAYVVWPLFVSIERAVVLYRLDQSELQTEMWSAASSGTAIGRFDNRRGSDLVRRIQGAGQMAIRVVPDRGGAREAVFDLTGAAVVAGEVLAACS